MKLRWVMPPLVLLALAGGSVGGAYAYDRQHEDVVAEGVTVAGVDVGGLRVTDARAKVERELVPQFAEPVTLTFRRRSFEITPQQARVRIDFDGMIDEAHNASRRETFLERAMREARGRTVDLAVPLRIAYSHDAVAKRIGAIKRELDLAPRDAEFSYSLTALRTKPSRNGRAVRARALERLVGARLTRPGGDRTVAIPVAVRKPKVSTADLRERYATFITIDRTSKRLRFFRNLRLARIYTIAVGQAGYDTPTGLHRVVNKAVNPSWHVPYSDWTGDLAGTIVPPGPSNPIKARWMGFYNGAGIHGTDAISSLGTAASHGCIRMSIPDVIELYDLVPTGTPIYIA